MTRRRLLAWVLTVIAVSAACGIAYPYVRYRAVSRDGIRGFEDRWSEPDVVAVPDCVVAITSSPDGESTFESVHNESGYTIREIDALGVIRQVVVSNEDASTFVSLSPDGAFLKANGRNGPIGLAFQPITEAEGRELLGSLLEPDGMPWPWWTKLPGFAGHLNP